MIHYITDYNNQVIKISQDQLSNATIYTDKFSALKNLIDNNIEYLEIGVLAGDYSTVVLNNKNIKKAILLDTYNSDDWEGCKVQRFNKDSHLSFIKNRFSRYQNVIIKQGNSQELLPLENEFFDYIYIDADHRFNYVLNDLMNACKMLKPNGIIGLNDFTFYQKPQEEKDNRGGFAVVEVVTQFLKINRSWEVVGLAFEEHGFNDIYLKRRNVI